MVSCNVICSQLNRLCIIYKHICTTYQVIAISVNLFYEFERKVRAGSDISRVLQVPINGIWFLKIFVTMLISIYAAPI